MKNAPTTNSSESVPNKRHYSLGTLPKLIDTVRAEVLACFLDGKVLTGMESVFAQNTTRLSAVVYALEQEYHWNMERHDMAVETKDGRIAWIVAYSLPPEVIGHAHDELGARTWIDQVKIARAKRKLEGFKRKREAALKNAAGHQAQDPRQQPLWGDA